MLATDCAEGMFGLVAAMIICIPLLLSFHHAQSMDVLLNPRMGFNPNPGISQPQPVNHPGYSLVNPFDAFKVQDWNFWMKVMGIFLGIYGDDDLAKCPCL